MTTNQQGNRPATAAPASAVSGAPEITTFVCQVDGLEVSVGVQPGTGAARSGVLVRISSPTLETVAGVCVGPDGAHRLAAALSSAAFAAAGGPAGRTSNAAAGYAEPTTGPGTGLTEITAVEGTPAADLSAAIALLAGSVLVDFASDVGVSLVFGPAEPTANHQLEPSW